MEAQEGLAVDTIEAHQCIDLHHMDIFITRQECIQGIMSGIMVDIMAHVIAAIVVP